MKTNRIVYIDEEPDQILLNVEALERYFGDKYEIEGVEPQRTISEMVGLIQKKTDLAALLIDERLKERGTANYLGIQLAMVIRELYPKLPIFILTSFAGDQEDFGESAGAVENVLDKADLTSGGQVIFQRVSRHLERYQDLLSGRDGRLSELIRFSLERSLNEEELAELNSLEVVRMAPIAMEEAPGTSSMESEIINLRAAIENAKKALGHPSGENE